MCHWGWSTDEGLRGGMWLAFIVSANPVQASLSVTFRIDEGQPME